MAQRGPFEGQKLSRVGVAESVRKWPRRLAALGLVTLMAVGCAASTGSSTPAATANAASIGAGGTPNVQAGASQPGGAIAGDLCSVVTQAQVDAVVGGSIGPGAEQNGGQMCLWQNPTLGQASISIDGGGSSYESLCSLPSKVTVDGVGDGACYIVGGAIATLLDFKKGAHSYTVQVVLLNGTVATVEAAEKTLAQEAAGKL